MSSKDIDLKEKNGFSYRLSRIIGDKTVRSFAITSGVDQKSLGKYLSGVSEPTLKNLLKLAEAGGVSVQWLATGAESCDAGIDDIESKKIMQLLSSLPDDDRREILSRAESLHKINRQSKELEKLGRMVAGLVGKK